VCVFVAAAAAHFLRAHWVLSNVSQEAHESLYNLDLMEVKIRITNFVDNVKRRVVRSLSIPGTRPGTGNNRGWLLHNIPSRDREE
jgi:hypothetical protein